MEVLSFGRGGTVGRKDGTDILAVEPASGLSVFHILAIAILEGSQLDGGPVFYLILRLLLGLLLLFLDGRGVLLAGRDWIQLYLAECVFPLVDYVLVADALGGLERRQLIHRLWLVHIVILVEVAALLDCWIADRLP